MGQANHRGASLICVYVPVYLQGKSSTLIREAQWISCRVLISFGRVWLRLRDLQNVELILSSNVSFADCIPASCPSLIITVPVATSCFVLAIVVMGGQSGAAVGSSGVTLGEYVPSCTGLEHFSSSLPLKHTAAGSLKGHMNKIC